MFNTENVSVGTISLIQQTETGRIRQIGITEEQSQILQFFLAKISEGNPLVQMGSDYDLLLRSSVCKKCALKNLK